MTDKKQKRPTHSWAADQDYFDTLSEADKEWAKQFYREYYYSNFQKGKKPIHPEYLRQDCYNRSNAMRRDAMVGATPLTCPEALDDGALMPLKPSQSSAE